MLRVPHDAVSADEASEFAERHYGLKETTTRRIPTERDDTFAVSLRGESEPRYILKFEHPAESQDSVLLRARSLALLQETQAAIPVTRLIPTRGGELVARFEQNETVRWATLTTFLHGVMVSALPGPLPRPLLGDIGFRLAQMQCALSGMSYSDIPGRVLWDMQLLPQVAEDLLPMIHEAESRRRVLQAVDDYMAVAPVIEQLPVTLCHGDFHPGNLMVDPDAPQRLSGILDFGDMHMMPPICDLGTCLSYLIDARSHPNDPLMPCRIALNGYMKGIGCGKSRSFVDAQQLDLLPAIMEARGALAALLPLMTERFSGVDASHYLTDAQQRLEKLKLVQDFGQSVADGLGIARQHTMLEHGAQRIITQHASKELL
ncbi:MAG: phosphotransferase [Bifidobacterium tibiigranuli]|nr:phosphotransferase [Bifidobacterium tibiigranuli]MCI1791713.1 phosphotransferase [Bifidobacterium tibiigranuli]MCI1796798.1 phosphotransferase [Bifidobacterium tibiigranuli]